MRWIVSCSSYAYAIGSLANRFDEKTFQEPLATITREALDYIQRNYLRETMLKRPDRAEATRV